MTFLDARALFEYWLESPPEHELVAVLARVYTTWRPQRAVSLTEEEAQAENLRSVEERWRTGQAMSPKQMVEAFGGGKVAIGFDGVYRNANGMPIPGVRPFPGMK